MKFIGTSMRDIYRERSGKRKRESSYDRTGGNSDYFVILPNSKKIIFDNKTSGCITHIWTTMAPFPSTDNACFERKVLLRMFWDGEENPSVEAPIGDFFGMGHGISKNFVSAPLNMSPQDGKGYNCYFPMPYEKGAKIEIENESERALLLYFYIDYEEYDGSIDSDLRFHAMWKREVAKGVDEAEMTPEEFAFGGFNLDGKDNYVLLEAKGKGHYVGCNMNIHNLRITNKWDWPGEGDDMIFIDDEPWPPRLHGTGTEDYFNTAWSPNEEYNAPYHGIILPGGANWSGKITYYRYHIQDPIMFNKSIKVTIEHGHNNHRSDDYTSTAYWYQNEPHAKFHAMLSVEDRMPLDQFVPLVGDEIWKIRKERDKRLEEMGLEE